MVSDSAWELSWAAIKSVWASKWNERAVSSMRKGKGEKGALQMAVLCQQAVPAAYAFVAHTKHPTTGGNLSAPRGRMCETGRAVHVPCMLLHAA